MNRILNYKRICNHLINQFRYLRTNREYKPNSASSSSSPPPSSSSSSSSSSSNKASKISSLPNYIETNVTNVYTSNLLNPEIDLSSYASIAKKIFDLNPKYIHPEEFKYQLPSAGIPEFAFIGRSNVGKSSLISNLVRNRAEVRISKSPGCTRSVNFFAFTDSKNGKINGIDSHKLYLVDLPGYGFAKASGQEKYKWKEFIESYILGRDPSILRRVYILIDSRHGMKDKDIEMMKILDENHITYQIILTKSDASSTIEKKNALQSCFNEIMAKRMSSCLPVVHLLSSKDSTGVIQLQQSIAEIANHQWAKTKIPLQPSKISQGLYPTPETNIELAEEIKSSLPGGWESYIDGEDTDLIIDKLNNAIINNK